MKCPSSPGRKCSEAANVECWGLTPILSPRCARARGGAHGQLPGGEGAPGQGKEQRKEGLQEARGEESPRHAVNDKAGTLLMHSAVRRRELYGGRLRAPGESVQGTRRLGFGETERERNAKPKK
jgi:hypothetical protein